MKGLIIDEPWIGKILRGEKVWEMRTTATAVRGRIALIRKGSGTVVGTANLIDSIGPLDMIACRAHRDKHTIPSGQENRCCAGITRGCCKTRALSCIRFPMCAMPSSSPWSRLVCSPA